MYMNKPNIEDFLCTGVEVINMKQNWTGAIIKATKGVNNE